MQSSINICLISIPFIMALLGCGAGLFPVRSGVPSAFFSSLTVTTANPTADGETPVTVRIQLRNAAGKGIPDVTPQYRVSGFRNTVTQNCSSTDSNGIGLCSSSLISGFAETKTLRLASPAVFDGGTVTFNAQSRGYNVRRCGFDMNRNGVRSETGDCRVCDGITNDPDGDGTNEDLIYVDSVNGNNGTGTGSPNAPYQTVTYALTQVDGPGDGAEDILCISGTFNGGINPTSGGRTTTYAVDGLLQPRDPLMIVGWDKDGDGIYPPLDTDDTAVFDGTNTTRWFWDNSSNQSYVELAHLTVRRYGDTAALGGGIWWMNGSGTRRYFSFHDMEFESINDGLIDNDVAQRYVLSAGDNAGVFSHFFLHNNSFSKIGGSFASIFVLSNTWSHFVMLSNTVLHNTVRDAAEHIYLSGIVDSRIEGNKVRTDDTGWVPATDSFRMVHVGPCTRRLNIVNNSFENVDAGLLIAFFAPACSPAGTIDDIVFDRNLVIQTKGNWDAVAITGAKFTSALSTTTNTTEDIKVTNNFVISKDASVDGCFWAITGNDGGVNPGTITFSGNTCVGPWQYQCMAFANGGNAFPHNNFVIQNNICIDTGTAANQIDSNYAPTSWIMNANVFSGIANWTWLGFAYTSLSSWQTASGGDAASRMCTPDFVDSSGFDYHLTSADTCARNQGINITSTAPLDYDGDARSTTLPDIGADEVR